MTVTIAPIVEGRGDKPAVGVIIRRIVAEINPPCQIDILRASRYDKDRLLQSGTFERAIVAAANAALDRQSDRPVILVLIDSDGG